MTQQVSAPNVYTYGDGFQATAVFTDTLTGELANPDTVVVVFVLNGDLTGAVQYTYGEGDEIANPSTGVFQVTSTTDQVFPDDEGVGAWEVQWAGKGNVSITQDPPDGIVVVAPALPVTW